MRYAVGAFLLYTIGYLGGDIIIASIWVGIAYGFIDLMKQGEIWLSYIKPTWQGSRKDEGERVPEGVLEDINLSLIRWEWESKLSLGIAQIVRDAETGWNQIFPP